MTGPRIKSTVLIHRIGGRADPLARYTVVSINALGMRIARAPELADAHRTRTEWTAGDYSFEPGEFRRFPAEQAS